MPRRGESKRKQRRIALRRMDSLMELAFSEIRSHPARSRRYVMLARMISRRCKIRIPRPWRRTFCRRCGTPLVPGRTSRVRLRSSRVNVSCTRCGMVHRYPYGRFTT